MGSSTVGTLDSIVDGLHDSLYVRNANLAASIVLFYDHIITLDQEVEFVWKEPWTKGKILFLLSRYYGLFASIFNNYALFNSRMSEPVRRFWISWQGWTGVFVNTALAQVILILRIRALYLNDRNVTQLLVGTLIITLTVSATIIGCAVRGVEVGLLHVAPNTYCRIGIIPSYLPSYFIPVSVFETILGGLAMYKWLKDVGFKLERRNITPALMYILVRDSTVYFTVMSLLYILNAVVWITIPNLFELPIGFLLAMSIVMGNRLILNLRVRHRKHAPRESALGLAVAYDLENEIRTRIEVSATNIV